jgi:type I restriction enzyme S subunit
MIADLKPYPAMKDSGAPWLGEVPAHWQTRPLKRWVRMNAEVLPETTGPDHEFRYLDIGSVATGILTQKPQQLRFGAAPSRARRVVHKGDTIVSTVRTYLKAIYFVDGEADKLVCSTGFAVLTPRFGTLPKFVSYLAQSNPFTDRVTANSVGIAPAIPETRLGSFHIAVPPFPEQAAIARFLDHADRRIRRYIRAKQDLIKLLEEQKQAISHRAITRGLDPNVRLKPSGVEWLGDVPEHWEVVTLRRVISRAVDGPHHSPSYVDQGIPFLSARNIKADRWSLDDAKFISEADYLEFSKRVVPDLGDVLYTKGGTTGVARAVDLDFRFQVWVHVAVLKVRRSKIVPEFLAAALNSPRCYEQAQLLTRGATNQDLGLSRMKDIALMLPPLPEQQAILAQIDESTSSVRSAIDRAHREISLLREYRTCLIADVVTGKLDVRAAATQLPGEPDKAEALDETDTLSDVEEDAGDDLDAVPEEAGA